MSKRSIILAISDTQEPFSHQDALEFVKHVRNTFYRPGDDLQVVHQGDEVDQHTLGKYASNPSGRSGGDELEEAKHRLRDWFKEFPKVRVCISNHSYRVYKKAFAAGIPMEFLKSINDVYEAPPGWKWADKWLIDDVIFEHGENVSGHNAALNAAIQNRKKTSIGHQHSCGGVQFLDSAFDQIWGLNTGCLIDVDQYAFDYGKNLRKKPTLGCGIIVNSIPMFVPMYLDKKKRWVKRIL
jgi:hypothetical protein